MINVNQPKLNKNTFAGKRRDHNALACGDYTGILFTRAHKYRTDTKQIRQVQSLTPC